MNFSVVDRQPWEDVWKVWIKNVMLLDTPKYYVTLLMPTDRPWHCRFKAGFYTSVPFLLWWSRSWAATVGQRGPFTDQTLKTLRKVALKLERVNVKQRCHVWRFNFFLKPTTRVEDGLSLQASLLKSIDVYCEINDYTHFIHNLWLENTRC